MDEEINTTTTGNSPGVPGRANGDFKINGKLIGKYNWIDHEDDCCRLRLSFWEDNKLALKAFLKSLDIKKKELKKELSENPDKSPQTPPKPSNHSDPVKPTNQTLIISLIIGGTLLILGIVIFLIKTKKRKVK